MKKNLVIISNEKFYTRDGSFHCDNIAEKTLPNGLEKKFSIEIIARKTKIDRSHRLKTKNISLFKFLPFYLIKIFKKIKEKNSKFLILSISPYTFFATLLFIFSKQKPIIYLRSDGHQEYRSILGFYGPIIFGVMFKLVSAIGIFLSCKKYILKDKKGFLVSPSELNNTWITSDNQILLDDIKLLYVGRVKVEKGIFSLLKIIKNSREKISLSIVGATEKSLKQISQENVNIYKIENNEANLIKYYDHHHIFVLPSFTEGHPMVLLEALARLRPVIIFPEISHVIEDKKGIFVSLRNEKSFFKTVHYIKSNYENIQREMKTNKLPTQDEFINNMSKLIANIE
mgnify:FL=1